MDNAIACYTGGPGSIPATSKWFFLSRAYGGGWIKNGANRNNIYDLAPQ